ncbi:MAG: glycosyltransferase family 39 protein [Candidatus Omnitrophica bacterium]|nr:glycosyltransferase family 39 protein [Candidatus Omnitrophota bacterium]
MKRSAWADPWLIGLLLLAAALLLIGLKNGRLWQDEAETAVLGRNVLWYGYPRAFDGINWVNPALPQQRGYAWTYHTWLPIYLAAGSFYLLGENSFSARLPFALIGLAAVWLAYRLFRWLTGEIWVARLAVGMMVTSVPFLLHMRQCRYYAPALFFTLWSVWAYWRFLERERRPAAGGEADSASRSRWGGLELVAALNLLFHSDHGAFLPVVSALILHLAWSRPTARQIRRGLSVLGLVLATTVPWMIYLKAWQHQGSFSWKELSHHLQFYFRQINRFLVPIPFWLVAVIGWRRLFQWAFGTMGTAQRTAWKLVGLLLGIGLAFLVLVPQQRHFRYLIFLVPWLLLAQAALLACLFRFRRWAAALALTLLLILTDLIHYSGASILAARIPAVRARLSSPAVKIRSLPLEYLTELKRPYRGPMDGVVELLEREGKPGDSVKIPYEELTLIFYCPWLLVEPLRRQEDFSRETFPDWVILRRDWLPSGFWESPYYRRIKARYRPIVLDAPDIPWQNRPDPGYHRFKKDTQAPPVVVFRRTQG